MPTHLAPETSTLIDVLQARLTAQAWVARRAELTPGLRAAHLVGGITAMDDIAPFPSGKDVDLHLIYAAGSPELDEAGPGLAIVEELFGGIAIEAGLKTEAAYQSPDVVLANPEVAYHLTVESILYDPDGLLEALQGPVRRDYARRTWVKARLEHERRGSAGAFDLLQWARAKWGASGELNILGYTTTFAAAAMQVAALQPPRLGGRVFLHLRESLEQHGRRDFYEALLAAQGIARLDAAAVEQFLHEAADAFDLVILLREAGKIPNAEGIPFAHKLHRHLRPYFVETCRTLLDTGHHHEAMGWILPYYLATADVINSAGPEVARSVVTIRAQMLLRALGLERPAVRAAAVMQARQIYSEIFALADAIIAANPAISD